jgi:hypothetical protein
MMAIVGNLLTVGECLRPEQDYNQSINSVTFNKTYFQIPVFSPYKTTHERNTSEAFPFKC